MTAENQRPLIVIQADMLPIPLKEYANRMNIALETVKSQAKRGIIPTVKLGKNKTIFVNQALMIVRSLQADGWHVESFDETSGKLKATSAEI